MDTWVRHTIGWGGLAALGFSGIWLFVNGSALRDASTQSPKPYSLSRVQLAWWTLIVLGAYVGAFAWKGQFWQLNSTCLALLGIGAGTTVAGRIVDTRQREAMAARHQDAQPSQGLFTDILSDENGVSVHRFQTVAFNIAYAVSFLVSTYQDATASSFPSFDATTLLVLGVSSSVYVAVKSNESSAPSTTASLAKPISPPGTLVPSSAQPPAESGPVATRSAS
jgi:hypothetical protein